MTEFYYISAEAVESLDDDTRRQLDLIALASKAEFIANAFETALWKKRMSSKEFGKLYGCAKANVSILKNRGTTNLKTIKRIADVFEMTVPEFIELGVKKK